MESVRPSFAFPGGRQFEHLDPGAGLAETLVRFSGKTPLFAELSPADLPLLAGYLDVYRARSQDVLVTEGEPGDFMLLIIEGEVDIVKTTLTGTRQRMSTVGPGTTVGEMSMIDGEPRFATCIAARLTTFAILTRAQMRKMITERPDLACKILVRLVSMLATRLRHTTGQLMQQIGT